MIPSYLFGSVGSVGSLEFKTQAANWQPGDQAANLDQAAIQDAQAAKLAYLLSHLKDAQDAQDANVCKGERA